MCREGRLTLLTHSLAQSRVYCLNFLYLFFVHVYAIRLFLPRAVLLQ